jgi:GT2 family glycosyltransferase
VIVAYHSRDLLRRCLESLFANVPTGPMRVFVVDNASNDGTVEVVRRDLPAVERDAST